AATDNVERIVGGIVDAKVPLLRLLESNALYRANRSARYPNAHIAGLKVTTDNSVLECVEIRCFEASDSAQYPEAIDENIFRSHVAARSDVDAGGATIEKHVDKGIGLQRRPAWRAIPIQVKHWRTLVGRLKIHPLEMRIPAAIRPKYRTPSGINDFRNKSSRTDNSGTMQFGKLYRRSYLVGTRREIQNAIGANLFSSMWVSLRTEAIVGGS